jgi:hypothetical protein
MKTTILLVFSLFMVSQSLHGQKFSYTGNSLIKDSKLTNNHSGFSKADTILKLFPNLDLFHRRNSRNFDFYHDKPFEDFVIVKSDPPYAVAEEFPGSSKYYAKTPSLSHIPGEENFILIPDTDSKYYLLIKDPKDGLFHQK